MILTSHHMQLYLVKVYNPRHRFVLTHFRMDIFHHLISFPTINNWSPDLVKCPCDDISPQSTMHTVLFCKYFLGLRKRINQTFVITAGCCTMSPSFYVPANVTKSINMCSNVTISVGRY